jgi:hypothetical protein
MLEMIEEVPRPLALRIMREVDALLLINDPAVHRYRPGKLYDYLAMRTPILVFGEGGEAAELVTRFRVGRVIPEGDSMMLRTVLCELVNVSSDFDSSDLDVWLGEHTRERVAGLMLDLLEICWKRQ